MRDLPREVPTIPFSYIRAIARAAGIADEDMGQLLAADGAPLPRAHSDDGLLTRSQLTEALSRAVNLTSDPAVGLKFGCALSPGTHGYLGFLAMASPDLRSALEAFGTYAPTRVSFVHFPVSVENDSLICRIEVDIDIDTDPDAYRCAAEACAVVLLQIFQFILGHPLDSGAVEFSFAAPQNADYYREFIPCPITFGAAQSRITAPLSIANTKNTFADQQNYELALNRCQALLRDLPMEKDRFTDRVRSVLLASPLKELNEETTAANLFISKRTMARRLKREGTRYSDIRDEVLESIAKSYLSESTLPVEAIAEILGYHDSASFRRAFKRWAGQTPVEYRDSYRCVKPDVTR